MEGKPTKKEYAKEALRLVELTKKDKNYSDCRFDFIIEFIKLSIEEY